MIKLPLSVPIPLHVLTFETDSPISVISLVASEQGLIRVSFGPSHSVESDLGIETVIDTQSTSKLLSLARDEIVAYLAGELKEFSLPIDWPAGNPLPESGITCYRADSLRAGAHLRRAG